MGWEYTLIATIPRHLKIYLYICLPPKFNKIKKKQLCDALYQVLSSVYTINSSTFHVSSLHKHFKACLKPDHLSTY